MHSLQIIVTGASGFIGRQLLNKLSAHHDVRGLSRTIAPGHDPRLWIEHDLLSAELPETDLNNVDILIHLAQSDGFRTFPEKAIDIVGVNVHGTIKMAEWARRLGARKFIFTSTGGVYQPAKEPVSETAVQQAIGDVSFYCQTKHTAEQLLQAYENIFTLQILRPFFVYGPGQRLDMLLPKLIENVIRSEPIKLHNPDGIRLNPIFISDFINAIEQLLIFEKSDVFNIAGSECMTLRQIATLIGEEIGMHPVFDVNMGQQIPDRIACIKKMEKELGAPTTKFSTGIVETVKYYKTI